MGAAGNPAGSAREFFPGQLDLDSLRLASLHCQGCELWARGTQTVFGEGPPGARLMLVGEQPGDIEDEMGRPFVGPAGRLLDRCLEAAGIDRESTYLTNTVKHFKWEARGKRRIHSKPNAREVRACTPWLEAEIAAVAPGAIVCLGATAAQALLGKDFRVMAHRGQFVDSPLAALVMATVHPSAILRAPDDETRRREVERLTTELGSAWQALTHKRGPA